METIQTATQISIIKIVDLLTVVTPSGMTVFLCVCSFEICMCRCNSMCVCLEDVKPMYKNTWVLGLDTL